MAEKKPIMLRIAPELHAALSRWAAQELRSLNAQVEYLLREAVRSRGLLREQSGPGGEAGPTSEPRAEGDAG